MDQLPGCVHDADRNLCTGLYTRISQANEAGRGVRNDNNISRATLLLRYGCRLIKFVVVIALPLMDLQVIDVIVVGIAFRISVVVILRHLYRPVCRSTVDLEQGDRINQAAP